MAIISFIVWVGLSVLVGNLAKKRGRDFGGWIILALFISPLLSGVILYLIEDLAEEERQKVLAATLGPKETADKLNQIKKLYEDKVLDESEYKLRKEKVVSELEKGYVSGTAESFLSEFVPAVKDGVLCQEDMKRIKGILFGKEEAG